MGTVLLLRFDFKGSTRTVPVLLIGLCISFGIEERGLKGVKK
jgi:hypothetical protein